MAASKSKTYFARTNYRFLSGDRVSPIATDTAFELDESDLWSSNRSGSPEFRNQISNSRVSKNKPVAKRSEAGATPASLPVNVPDWSKILKEDYRDNNRRRGADADDDYDSDGGDGGGDDGGDRIPPHEFLARQFAAARIASFSVHEGIGRTLKGRDLSRVRNAIWAKTGFQD